jgi:porphobilinogen synthase
VASNEYDWLSQSAYATDATHRFATAVQQHPLKEVPDLALRARELNLGGVLLFGLPEHKDPTGTSAYAEQGVVQEAVRAMKATAGDLVVITDVCLCEYTSHGHCGILEGETVNNDATLELLQRVAVSHAQAGADVVAPSDMMDGRVGAIRSALDQAGLEHTPILSYAAKYASAYYGPFRVAADSAPEFGDRRGYQMDPGNGDEALREVELDFEEGADMVMVKPGMPCLDIVRRVKERFGGPVAVYQVSGEFSMIKLADEAGALDGTLAMREALLAMRRAGADIIVTYAAPEITFD